MVLYFQIFLLSILLISCNAVTDISSNYTSSPEEVCESKIGCKEVTSTGGTILTLSDYSNSSYYTRFYDGDFVYIGGKTNTGSSDDAYILKFNVSTGSLDSSFGNSGSKIFVQTYTQFFVNFFKYGNNIYGIGEDNGPSNGSNPDFLIWSVDSTSGNANTAFNTTGKKTQNYPGNWYDSGYFLSVLSDNKLYTCGYAYKNATTGYDAVISRYSLAGALDTTFGVSGNLFFTAVANANTEACYKIFELDSGKKLVYGIYLKAGQYYQAFFRRYNSDWTLDTSFANSGLKLIDLGIYSFFGSEKNIKIEDDNIYIVGKYVQTSTSLSQAAILKLKLDTAEIDTSFGTNGLFLADPGCVSGDSSNFTEMKIYSDYFLMEGVCNGTNRVAGFIVPVLKSGEVDPYFNNGKSYYFFEDPTIDSYSDSLSVKQTTDGAKVYTFNKGVIKEFILKWK